MDPRHSSHRRRALIAGALLLLPAMLLGLRYPASGAASVWTVAWMAILAGAALLSGRERFASLAFHGAAFVSGLAATALVLATGGTGGPRFGFLLALAPLVLVAVPDLPWASALAGGVALAGGLWIIAAEGRGAWFAVDWMVTAASVLVLSAVGAVGFRNLWCRELQATTEYSQALLRLAESERRRERADRFAFVAKLAARLAHELNNPLAVVKANLAWLAEPSTGGRDIDEDADVLRDARAGVERVSLIAADLRDLAKAAPGETARREVSRIIEDALAGVDATVRGAVRVEVDPSVHVVVDGGLLARCIRHVVVGGASLAQGGDGSQPLCLHATLRAGEIVVQLEACGGRTGAPERDEGPIDGSDAVTPGELAGLHLALAAEHARAVGGALETLRASNGALRFCVRLPGGSGPAEWAER